MSAVVDPQQSGIGNASLVSLLCQRAAADYIGVTTAAQQKGQAQCLVVARGISNHPGWEQSECSVIGEITAHPFAVHLGLDGCDRAIPHDVLRSAVGIDVPQCEPGVWS